MTATTQHTIALVHALILNPDLPGDAERCQGTYGFAYLHLPLLANVLGWAEHELIDTCLRHHRVHGVPPTRKEFDAVVHWYHSLRRADLSLDEVGSSTLAPVDAAAALEALDSIVASLTRSPNNPDGPIRRSRDGAFLDGSEGPILTGTPTERLTWLALYYLNSEHNNFMSVKRLLKQVGGSNEAMQAAIRSLTARGIVHRIHEPGIGPMVRLHDIHSRKSADARADYQLRLAEGKQTNYSGPFFGDTPFRLEVSY
jgi:hypothetical protein